MLSLSFNHKSFQEVTMAIARKKLIREGIEGTYHVYNRTVRHAYLQGIDKFTGKDFSHRKLIMEKRIQFLAGVFSIDVCGFAILSNHFHLILRIRPDIVAQWDSRKIARQWWQIFSKRKDRHGNPADPKDHELDEILCNPKTGEPEGRLEELRKRLMSISWFMRCLNEYVAKVANAEDRCTGRFWEGRFKSTALLDQSAVLACLAYVDLNPIHAGMAETPEESDYTSAQKRIENKVSRERLLVLRQEFSERKKRVEKTVQLESEMRRLQEKIEVTSWLSPISKTPYDQTIRGTQSFLNMDLDDYLVLLDWTGKQARKDKPGKIPTDLEPILTRLDIATESWLSTVKHFDNWFHNVAGKLDAVRKAALVAGNKWFAGVKGAKTAFN
jgi:REP element-mobilizing transposase RayT